MKYCVSARQNATILASADEIMVEYRDREILMDLAVKYPHATLILQVPKTAVEIEWTKFKSVSKQTNLLIALEDIKLRNFCRDNGLKYYKMNDILPKHRVQAVSYCSLLQVDAVIFLYVERDLLNKKTFYYKPTKQEKSAWKKRMTFLNDCVKNKIIPEKPAGINCQYCGYKKLCKKLGEGKLRYEPSKKL